MKILRDMGYEVEVACSNVGFADKIEQEGFRVYTIPFSRNPLSYRNIKAIVKLYKIMKENHYVMIHTHTPVASFLGRIIAKVVGIPHIVYTAHGFHFHELGNPIENFIYFRLEKLAGRFTDVLITINKDDYKVAVERNIVPNGKVVYIKGVGVDTERFDSEKVSLDGVDASLANSLGGIFISVGRLEREKHFDHLLKAFLLVKQKRSDFKLLIIGDGAKGDYLKNLSIALNLQSNIEFLGYIKGVEKFLKVSNVFVFASSREGLPVSLMEAMAMEKPIVAYNIRGVRDLVEDGVNGFLVKFGDIDTLAERILYLMENPDIAKEMGKRGREKIEREFSLNVILPQMMALYREILEEK
jgi:glycosyltransferase involved in cell wall biosynthesis